MFAQRDQPTNRRVAIVEAVDGATGGVGGDGGEKRGGADAEAQFLALHVAAGLRQRPLIRRLVHADRGQLWIARLLCAQRDKGAEPGRGG